MRKSWVLVILKHLRLLLFSKGGPYKQSVSQDFGTRYTWRECVLVVDRTDTRRTRVLSYKRESCLQFLLYTGNILGKLRTLLYYFGIQRRNNPEEVLRGLWTLGILLSLVPPRPVLSVLYVGKTSKGDNKIFYNKLINPDPRPLYTKTPFP